MIHEEWWPLDRVPHTPRVSGVYFLIKAGEVVYVGQSVDVIGRVRAHEYAAGKDFDYAVWEPVDDLAELNRLENQYIQHYKGKYNSPNDHATGRRTKSCLSCGKGFVPARADGCYCSNACRQSAYRERTE